MKQLLLAASTTDSSGSSITEPAAAQLNALQKWWASIDWESIIGILIQKALMLLFLCILFGILLKISNMIIDRIYRSYEKSHLQCESNQHDPYSDPQYGSLHIRLLFCLCTPFYHRCTCRLATSRCRSRRCRPRSRCPRLYE